MQSYAGRFFRGLLIAVSLAQTCTLSAFAQRLQDASSRVSATIPRGSIPTPVEQHQAGFVQPLAAELPMRITVVLLPPKRSDLQKLVAQITDPRSPRYRQFLTYEQWKREYAPSENDVGVVVDWAERAGLRLVYRFPTNTAVVVQGSVATVERALRVQLSEYDFKGHHFFSNNRRPSLPTDIAARVDTILDLNSFEQAQGAAAGAAAGPAFVDLPAPRVPTGEFISRSHWERNANDKAPSGANQQAPERPRNAITGPLGGTLLEPPDLWNSQAYNYNALFKLSHCCNPTNLPTGSPKETSIAIVGNNKPQATDYQAFFATYNLAANVTEITFNGSSCCDNEMTLDIEWAGAMSNSFGSWQQTAQLFVYESGGTKLGDHYSTFLAALADDNARILSTSFGSWEDHYRAFGEHIGAFHDVTTAMTAIGWTIVVAAGDQGAYANCDKQSVNFLAVQYPASDPNVIAAGGTTIKLNPAGAGIVFGGESAWSGNGCSGPSNDGGGGGGGCSNTFFAPWWSSQITPCLEGRRPIPDISLNAGNPQAFFYGGQWVPAGGGYELSRAGAGGILRSCGLLPHLHRLRRRKLLGEWPQRALPADR